MKWLLHTLQYLLGAASQETEIRKNSSCFSSEQWTQSGARCKYRQPLCNDAQSIHKTKSLDRIIHSNNIISRMELRKNEAA